MKWLSELSDMRVFISSYSKTAEAEYTASIVHALVCSTSAPSATH